MNWAIDKYGKRILAVWCVVLIVLLQVVFVIPSDADTVAGEELEVRVQYEGERGGKIRTIAVFSNDDLEEIGAYNTQYVNITRVGTLMKTAAYAVDLTGIIDAAGIDQKSVKSFTFRTTDGYTMTFNGDDYLGAAGWYYPELGNHSSRVDWGDGYIQMEEGALDGATRDSYPAIAIKSYSVKGFKVEPSFSKMSGTTSYRFLTGQTDLSYLMKTDEDGNVSFDVTKKSDITAWDSVKYIYGIDIVLKGTPPLDGISLDVIGDTGKVGSQVQIQVTFEGDTLGNYSMEDVTWSSSDESVATVDENGNVTILKEGKVTITAEAGGKTASVILGGSSDEKDNPEDKDKADTVKATESKETKATKPESTKTTKEKADKKQDKKQDNKQNNKPKQEESKKTVVAREINIGEEILPKHITAKSSVSVKSDTQALEEAESYDKDIVTGSAAAAVLACGGGAVFRIRRFWADMGKTIKSKH